MKFLYEYRTKSNERQTGEISASSRDAVYAELKKQGIKPSRVELAPGFFNRIRQFGKRWLAIFVLTVALVAVLVLTNRRSVEVVEPAPVEPDVASAYLDDTSRRQIIGDTAVIELGIKTGWSSVFKHEGERFLASFAIPGVPAGQRNTTEAEILAVLDAKPEPASEEQGIEARQIRSMVEGMKAELRQYLADGGTVVGYGRRLVQRQEAELGYYNRAKEELERLQKSNASEADVIELWTKRNDELRRMGIKLIALPE